MHSGTGINWIISEFKFEIRFQPIYDWCKNQNTNKHFPFDIAIEKFKLIIECDGDQHFRQVWNWQSPEDQQERDIYKMKVANNNGYTVIRVPQDYIYNDTYNWKKQLRKHIIKFDTPKIIYIGDVYKNWN